MKSTKVTQQERQFYNLERDKAFRCFCTIGAENETALTEKLNQLGVKYQKVQGASWAQVNYLVWNGSWGVDKFKHIALALNEMFKQSVVCIGYYRGIGEYSVEIFTLTADGYTVTKTYFADNVSSALVQAFTDIPSAEQIAFGEIQQGTDAASGSTFICEIIRNARAEKLFGAKQKP